MDIAGWLRNLGLGQYEALFRASEIDADILPELTDVDLEKLRIPLGHRKRLLRAISGLTAAETSAAPSASTGATPHDAAERRQLTVMFCDLVGSTALSTRFDPEELREEIRAYQNAVSGVAARYGGFVAKYMGDRVLAYFGYPRAHEDDAARAVRAGLEIAAAVASLETRGMERLAARHRHCHRGSSWRWGALPRDFAVRARAEILVYAFFLCDGALAKLLVIRFDELTGTSGNRIFAAFPSKRLPSAALSARLPGSPPSPFRRRSTPVGPLPACGGG
jgi:hypothetical protein